MVRTKQGKRAAEEEVGEEENQVGSTTSEEPLPTPTENGELTDGNCLIKCFLKTLVNIRALISL